MRILLILCRLYSCLANGSADEFQKGEHLFKAKAVKDALQIGNYYNSVCLQRNVTFITRMVGFYSDKIETEIGIFHII